MNISRGFSLLEILVAMAISLGLVGGFLLVLQRSQLAFLRQDSLARLQDAARQALDVISQDLEHAGFYGQQNAGEYQLMRSGAPLADETQLRQPTSDAPTPAVGGLPAQAHDCGVNFAVDLRLAVQGSDNGYALGVQPRDCEPTAVAQGARARADTLTVRRASLETVTPRPGRLQLYTQARGAFQPLRIFADGQAPGPLDSTHEVRDLEVRSYYVANSSVDRPGWPALRVKSLTESRGACQFRDEEIMPGVEDLQLEFVVRAADGRRQFSAPQASGPPGVVSVRLWLRIRADVTEAGFEDRRVLHYANTEFAPSGEERRHRRELFTRMVSLRNASP